MASPTYRRGNASVKNKLTPLRLLILLDGFSVESVLEFLRFSINNSSPKIASLAVGKAYALESRFLVARSTSFNFLLQHMRNLGLLDTAAGDQAIELVDRITQAIDIDFGV